MLEVRTKQRDGRAKKVTTNRRTPVEEIVEKTSLLSTVYMLTGAELTLVEGQCTTTRLHPPILHVYDQLLRLHEALRILDISIRRGV